MYAIIETGGKQLKVEANADTPKDIENALKFGAEGVGLCRTEHMFMDPDRLPWVQKMIIAGTTEARKEALDKLLPMQYADFYAMFKALGDKPLTVRLLDPPLHEFLPDKESLIAEVADRVIRLKNGQIESNTVNKHPKNIDEVEW